MSNTHRDNLNAKRKRGLVEHDWHWLCEWPRWWDVMFHRRPARRKSARRLNEVLRGLQVTDWPDYKRPHRYFW